MSPHENSREHSPDQAGAGERGPRGHGSPAADIPAAELLASATGARGASARSVLALQRRHGNRFVAGALRAALARQTAPSSTNFRVLLVEYGMSRMTERIRETIRSEVEADLDAIAAKSTNAGVSGGFTVEYRTAGLSSAEIKKLGSRDFVIYVMSGRDAADVAAIAGPHVGELSASDLETIGKQLKSEGGAALPGRAQNLGFVSTKMIESELRFGPIGEDEQKKIEASLGRFMAEIVLHEIGHLLTIKHSTSGIMTATGTWTTVDYERRSFAAGDQKAIRSRLEKLAP